MVSEWHKRDKHKSPVHTKYAKQPANKPQTKGETMKNKILAVRDTKAEAFLNPITVKSIGEAERSFVDEVNRPDSMMYKYPEDFGLYLIGEFDTLTGIVLPEPQPKHIASAINVKKLTQ